MWRWTQLAGQRERNVGIKGVWVTLGAGPAVAAGRSNVGSAQGWPEVINQRRVAQGSR